MAARDDLPGQWHVTDELLSRCPNLLCVSSSGAGYDTIDVDACTRAGVAVVNQAGGNAVSVAEQTIGLMIAVSRRLCEQDRRLRSGERFSREDVMGLDIGGRTLGLVGMGHIGTRVASLARAFNMTVFATAAHLVSWAKFAPIEASSAGRKKGAGTGKGNPWLAGTLGEIVASSARTDTFLGERYRRLVRRRGKKRAIVAVGNSILTIIWHLLSNPETRYHDLGADYHQSLLDKGRRQRDLIRQLEHLTGQKVTLPPTPDNPLPTAA